ncbi:radical SAM protein [Desulfolucanica intricata]|uniref:radical SAM protein n=1 Tax=Desulfolucanica intricata TaxID=1285191 RepID=UPI00082DD2D5|nr:radical SAM protein [Desulfolucanica intricata]
MLRRNGKTSNIVNRKRDRQEIFLELTRSLCPECRKVIDAEVLVKGNSVYLHKYCPEHGWFDCLISSDAGHYRDGQQFNKPGTLPQAFASIVKNGCPEDCGLCPEHKQHTCLGIIEITDACDLNCSNCLTNSGGKSFLSLRQIEKMLNLYQTCEGKPEVIQISGGEPTLHPELFAIINTARKKGIQIIQLKTNGLRIAQDDCFLEKLTKIKPAIYLEFDGLSPETYYHLRGLDLLEIKLSAIEKLAERDYSIVLSSTIARGINEHEIGKIAEFAIKHPAIKGVLFQPAAFTGRFRKATPLERTTLPDIIKSLEIQTGKTLLKSDFIPVPCSFPGCFAITYVYNDLKQITTLPRLIDVENNLNYFKNRNIVDLLPLTRNQLEVLWSASATPGSDRVSETFVQSCGLSPGTIPGMEKEITMIGIQALMDPYNFDLKLAKKCCTHIILPEGKMVPYCVYNNLRRGC